MMSFKIVFLFSIAIPVLTNGQNLTMVAANPDNYIPRPGDLCTNECSESDARYWCGAARYDATGNLMRCVQYTRHGKPCVDQCGSHSHPLGLWGYGQKYTWCYTNAYRTNTANGWWGYQGWWGYCSLVGYTINKKPCTDECSRKGTSYWWCHTGKKESSSWDYCSPPGLVQPVQFTVHGRPCITECRLSLVSQESTSV